MLQDILHRHRAINRLDAIQPAFHALPGVVDDVFPVDEQAVGAAKDILLPNHYDPGKGRTKIHGQARIVMIRVLLGTPWLSSRGALHMAIMRRHRIERILTFDRGFDGIPGVARLS